MAGRTKNCATAVKALTITPAPTSSSTLAISAKGTSNVATEATSVSSNIHSDKGYKRYKVYPHESLQELQQLACNLSTLKIDLGELPITWQRKRVDQSDLRGIF